MTIKELFDKAQTEGKTLTFEQFEQIAKENNAKFADISEGQYVSKRKYEDELQAKDKAIEDLNGTIAQRDTDLSSLQEQLKAAGTDAEKLSTVSNDLTALQTKYNDDIKQYQQQIKKQAYEFAVKEFAATKKFTSQAAKRDFIQSMISKELKMDKDRILGADDFVTSYSEDNADAFVQESAPAPEPAPAPKPTFAAPTQGTQTPDPTGGFASAFHFTEIHPRQS